MSWALLQNSVVVAALASAAGLLLGGATALFSATLPRWGARTMVALAVAAFALPPFLVTNTWLHYFGLAGVWRGYVDFDVYSLAGTVLVLGFMYWPITFLFLFFSIPFALPLSVSGICQSRRNFPSGENFCTRPVRSTT